MSQFYSVCARGLALCVAGGTFAFFPRSVEGVEPGAAVELSIPEQYVVDYPVADSCCPPIRSTFFEAVRRYSVVRGKRFRHKPNGGYGLPVVDKIDGKNLLHVGADLGWYQVGEPVFAIANGVVRWSTGPNPKSNSQMRPEHLSWGNFVAIEHRFAGDEFFTTLYGHLGPERLVTSGDIVKAGQMIGEIGRNHVRVNGGYKPHLHFGVRSGRMAETNAALFRITISGRPATVRLGSVTADRMELVFPVGVRPPTQFSLNGEPLKLLQDDGKTWTSSRLLWTLQRPEFALVGYSLSTEGWLDPVKFLRERHADTRPARFHRKENVN